MSVAERESEILKFETQEREDKHETMRILNIPYSYGTENELFYLLENAQFSSRIEQFSTILLLFSIAVENCIKKRQ